MRLKKLLTDLKFPVYKITKPENIEVNGLGLVVITTLTSEYILDDKNNPDTDYANRRIKLKSEGYKLYPMRTRINTLDAILKYPSGALFIDAEGYLFKYLKGRKMYPLKCVRISKRVYDYDRGSLLFSNKLPFPITYKDIVPHNIKYMGVLLVDGGGILHSLLERPFKDTRRKI